MPIPYIRHAAVIKSVASGLITVEIESAEACGSCAAQKVCGSGQTKAITLEDDGLNRQVGDNVTIAITRSMGITAIALAYLVPVFLIIATLLLLNHLQIAEMTAAWCALIILALYFVGVRIFRDKLKNQITITIE